ncbi:ly6/PLAUR domain-containing protein 4 isoform X2 [Moschus berezovskii]|uniref:ly6/PLAUR domain-containing protein 4 isoform X2 n=1 Tax=Moschus berezovskii TaxID=68408 RepID=UPI0024438E3B|nr:ly6/PLAUR domain-containing protein 4 isoform X2 [Moschus berezovskii]
MPSSRGSSQSRDQTQASRIAGIFLTGKPSSDKVHTNSIDKCFLCAYSVQGTGTRKGILGFKGCSPASSYPPQVSYLVSPPGLSIASYSRVCRTYLCNNLTNMDAILHLKARTPKTLAFSSHSCPTCVGEHSKSCLPNFVSTESCPRDATKCYSSTVKFQAGLLNTTFLLMGCAREHTSVLAHFHHIGSIRVTEVINIIEKALFTGAGTPCRSPSWGLLLGLLFAFKG